MKIYGYTISGPDRSYLYPTEKGNIFHESLTNFRVDKETMLNHAYADYKITFEAYEFEHACDYEGTPFMSIEEFKAQFPESITIQASDEHATIDFYVQEV